MVEGLPKGFPAARRYAANADQSMERRRGQDAISSGFGTGLHATVTGESRRSCYLNGCRSQETNRV
jgi:hypothetical protein